MLLKSSVDQRPSKLHQPWEFFGGSFANRTEPTFLVLGMPEQTKIAELVWKKGYRCSLQKNIMKLSTLGNHVATQQAVLG